MLYGPSGEAIDATPGPNELTIERLNKDLAEHFDPLLHIRWLPCAYVNPRTHNFEGRYALCCWWPDADPRRQEVREGKYPPQDAFDRIYWFTEDMHDANSVPQDPASMYELVKEAIHKMDNNRYPWKERMQATVDHNKALREKREKQIADLASGLVGEAVGVKSTRYGSKDSSIENFDLVGHIREIQQETDAQLNFGGSE